MVSTVVCTRLRETKVKSQASQALVSQAGTRKGGTVRVGATSVDFASYKRKRLGWNLLDICPVKKVTRIAWLNTDRGL